MSSDQDEESFVSAALSDLREKVARDRKTSYGIWKLVERCRAERSATTIERLAMRLRAAPDHSAEALKLRDELRAQRDELRASQPWRRRR